MNTDYHFEIYGIPHRDIPNPDGPKGDLRQWLERLLPSPGGSKLVVHDIRICRGKYLVELRCSDRSGDLEETITSLCAKICDSNNYEYSGVVTDWSLLGFWPANDKVNAIFQAAVANAISTDDSFLSFLDHVDFQGTAPVFMPEWFRLLVFSVLTGTQVCAFERVADAFRSPPNPKSSAVVDFLEDYMEEFEDKDPAICGLSREVAAKRFRSALEQIVQETKHLRDLGSTLATTHIDKWLRSIQRNINLAIASFLTCVWHDKTVFAHFLNKCQRPTQPLQLQRWFRLLPRTDESTESAENFYKQTLFIKFVRSTFREICIVRRWIERSQGDRMSTLSLNTVDPSMVKLWSRFIEESRNNSPDLSRLALDDTEWVKPRDAMVFLRWRLRYIIEKMEESVQEAYDAMDDDDDSSDDNRSDAD